MVSMWDGNLQLIGRLEVQQIVSRNKAQAMLKHFAVWQAKDHVIATDDSIAKQGKTAVPTNVTERLLFENAFGTKPLKFVSRGVLDNQTLRGVRKLTDASAKLLETLLQA